MSKKNTILSWGNPYTHESHERECVNNSAISLYRSTPYLECDWCGSKPKRLFKYDGDKHLFCNKECYKSYHGF